MKWLLLNFFLFISENCRSGNTEGIAACESNIWCDGNLLHDVQSAGIFSDSKTFVDMNLKEDPDVVLSAYSNISENSSPVKSKLKEFVNTYFEGPGNEFEPWMPTDYVERPRFIEKIADENLKQFGIALCKIWADLGRKIKEDVKLHQDRYSLLYLENPFIVPGGRFREIYYWDSYWVVKGLLICEMKSTVKGMLENLISFVKRSGHGPVPNGGRIYYTRRSQPPLLIAMVDMYMNATNDADFMRQNIEYLHKEYEYWNINRSAEVQTRENVIHVMNRYAASTTKPRPESYREDLFTVGQLNLSKDDAEQLYSNLASAAESGWDFSSRWFSRDYKNTTDKNKWLGFTNTNDVIPVDLNSIMCWNERLLAKFYGLMGKMDEAKHFQELHDNRVDAVHDLFWNESAGIWYDYHLSTTSQNEQFYPSNVFPLFVGCFKDSVNKTVIWGNVLQYLKNVGVLDYQSGIPTSLIESGQQWDYPNAWPPLEHIVITALADSGLRENHLIAKNLTQKWVQSSWIGWKRTKHMFEKYVVNARGSRGSGGEYDVQEGFGWTNGVILDFLDRFGADLHVQNSSSAGTRVFSTIRLQALNVVIGIVVCTYLFT